MKRLIAVAVLSTSLILTGCSSPEPEETLTPAEEFHAYLVLKSKYWASKSTESTYAVAKDICDLEANGYSKARVTLALIEEENVPDQAAADFVDVANSNVC